MEAVVNRDAEAAWPFIGDKFSFCTMFVKSWVTNDKLANSFLKYEVLPQATDPKVLTALAELAIEYVGEEEGWNQLNEEVLRVGWMTLRTAVDTQTGLSDAKRQQLQKETSYDPAMTYDGTKVLTQPAGVPRGDLLVTFNDGEALTIEVKGRAKGEAVPANLAQQVEWVKEALEMYEDPAAFYEQIQDDAAADWHAEHMMDVARGK
jgi:hypothetical protein